MAGDIKEESTDLLNEYNFIVEYDIYKKYKDLDGKAFSMNQIEENYQKAKGKYKKYSSLSNKELKRLIKSKLPFLLDEFSFDEIIKKYCKDYYHFYQTLSVIIHPGDLLLTYPKLQGLNFQPLLARLAGDFLEIINKEYAETKISTKKNLASEKHLILDCSINISYLDYAAKEKEELYKAAKDIEKEFGENTDSYLFKELGNSIEEIAYDKTFGSSEIVKCKVKPIIEMSAFGHYIDKIEFSTSNSQILAKLVTKQTRIRLMDIEGVDSKDEADKAFELYKKIKPEISRDEYDDSFKYGLGFIPEKPSINKFVEDYIDSIIPKSDIFNQHMKMVYDESQFLSHAEGYMISCNTGAFMEYSPVMVFIDICAESMLDSYIDMLKTHDIIENDNKYSSIIKALSCYLSSLKNLAQKKNEMDKKFNDCKTNYVG